MRIFFNSKKFIYLFLIILGSLRFINIWSFELQEWDESLYAVRAKSVIYFNDWIDQTPHSIEGLYSSSHPPMYIWLTAISYIIFGINEFSSRLISALAGIGSIIFIYEIGRILFNKETGFIASIFLGVSSYFSFWTRQGQFDSLLCLFFIASFYFYILFEESEKSRLTYIILSGVFIGFGLMTKLFVAIIIPIIILVYEFIKNKKFYPKSFFCLIIIPLIISAPWHIFMIFKYGNGDPMFFFKQAEMLERTFSGIEGNAKQLGLFYYMNQMIIFFPYLCIFFLTGIYIIYKEKLIHNILLYWFLFYFIIIMLITTKLSVYLLPLISPLILISSFSIVNFLNNKISEKHSFIILLLTNFLVFWSIDQYLRKDIRSLLPFKYIITSYYPIIIAFILICLILFLLYKYKLLLKLSNQILLVCIFLPLFISTLNNFFVLDKIKYNTGIKEIVSFLNYEKIDNLISIGDGSNPQLTYYLDGADIGWKNDYNFIRLEPKRGCELIKKRLDTIETKNTYVIIEKEEIALGKFNNYSDVISSRYIDIIETKGYAIFKKAGF